MDNIYLITGNSYYLMEEEINKIVGDNICSTFDLNTTELSDILEEANYFSLFDEKKYMIVKSADIFTTNYKTRGKAKKVLEKVNKNQDLDEEEQEILEEYNKKFKPIEEYLNNSNPNTVIIFSSYGKTDKGKEITNIIKTKYKNIEIADLKPDEIKKRITEFLKKDKYTIDDKCLTHILKVCKNNYDLSLNEAKKLELYYNKPTKINIDDVIAITSSSLEDNNFKFVDTIMSRNIKESFKIYDDLMIQKVAPIMILSMLAKEIRNTLIIKRLMKNYNKQEIMEMMEIKYPFQYDKYVNYTYQFKEKQLEDYLLYLCDNDYRIKRGKIGDKLALQLFIMKICE